MMWIIYLSVSCSKSYLFDLALHNKEHFKQKYIEYIVLYTKVYK